MARDFVSLAFRVANDIARESARQQRHNQRLARQQQKFAEQQAREAARDYLESRRAEVDDRNEELQSTLEQLQSLLPDALARTTAINWASLFRVVDEEAVLRHSGFTPLGAQPIEKNYVPRKPGTFARLVPGWQARFQRKVELAMKTFVADAKKHAELVQQRNGLVLAAKREAEAQNREVVVFRDAYRSANPTAVVAYFQAIFDRSAYPDSFPRNRRIFYVPSSHQLVVEFQVPSLDEAVPAVERCRYVKSTNQIVETKRPIKERHALYSNVLAQISLRHLHEVFSGDREEIVQVVVLNALLHTTDPATGQPVKPCVISVRATRAQFEQLDLNNVEPLACLKRLSAAVSRSPAELVPVKPVMDIDMVDPRFIEEADVLSTLDSRPNLMELTPNEFEFLTTNLFEKMGLEAKQTVASRDGGVDCVAFDPRPILGGKVVVQAKRYKNTVGVSAVRDLFGTMMNEGASKGILLTTSGYGKAAYEFANGKPIELLDGSNLLYLLREHAGIDAKIVTPEDWVDPRPNA